MIDLPYSLVIEATDEPDCFGFYQQGLPVPPANPDLKIVIQNEKKLAAA